MRHLVDAHSLIWALDDPCRLGTRAIGVLEDPAKRIGRRCRNDLGTLHQGRTGKAFPVSAFPHLDGKALVDLGVVVSPITLVVAEQQMSLPFHHRDPFDRLLVAQCLVEAIPIVSADSVFDQYGVGSIWE